MLNFEDAVPLLRRWAEENPYIERLWVFGSYVNGKATRKSDLDIAVEIKVPRERRRNEDAFSVYICDKGKWKEQLELLLEFKEVQVEQYEEGGTPTIQAGLDESKLLVYP